MKKVLTIINKCLDVLLIGFLVYFSFFILYKISSLIGAQVIFSNLTAYEFFFLFFPLLAADAITLGTTLVPLLFLGTIVVLILDLMDKEVKIVKTILVGVLIRFLFDLVGFEYVGSTVPLVAGITISVILIFYIFDMVVDVYEKEKKHDWLINHFKSMLITFGVVFAISVGLYVFVGFCNLANITDNESIKNYFNSALSANSFLSFYPLLLLNILLFTSVVALGVILLTRSIKKKKVN